jgi:hypothetical protein
MGTSEVFCSSEAMHAAFYERGAEKKRRILFRFSDTAMQNSAYSIRKWYWQLCASML